MSRVLTFFLCGAIGATCLRHSSGAEPPMPDPLSGGEPLVGSAAPDFAGIDDAGQPWRSADYIGKQIVVLYFYPGDFTNGCAKQAQAFRQALARLEELGVKLVGVSGDEVATHKLFKESHDLKHTLVADPNGALAERLGVPVQRPAKPVKVRTRDTEGKPLLDALSKSIFVERKVTMARWTVIVGHDGNVISKRAVADPEADADEVTKIVNELPR